ncbi:acyl-CoA binding protein [Tieghemostelium lacteum]|uniref:Acyl-CoA binding protein n=1 Tax=Tieghemostelium lacteum TaxID=361077 RepID=A0A152A1Z2_TIELA|nr:acyl-CoA binding protein [Tieghemostelium lacteum]|eukprot:KYR00272.1 acyl-CoA binding protein [Tieghemostelium lacteum]
MSEEFTKASAEVKTFTTKPINEELLELYGLYKQATEGDNTGSQPWAVQIEAKAKWEAWNKHKGTSKEAAQKAYVDLVAKLRPKYA